MGAISTSEVSKIRLLKLPVLADILKLYHIHGVEATSFLGSSLFLSRESTLVAARRVSARDSRDVIEGRGWKVKVCLSTLAYCAQ